MPEVLDKIKVTTNKQQDCSRARDKFVTRWAEIKPPTVPI
jgi:hypothetical protein